MLVEDSSIVDKEKDTCKVSQTDGMILYLMIIVNIGQTSTDPEISDLQVFQLFPPACMQEGKLIHPTTDWSRTARNKISLLKAASDRSQTKVTSYYDMVKKVSNIVQESPQLQQVLGTIVQGTHKEAYDNTKVNPTEKFSAILKQLLSNAIRNANKAPQGKRHDIVIKKFAVSLFILSGPMAYDFFVEICQKLYLV